MHRSGNKIGMSLVAVLVALALVATLMMSLIQLLKTGFVGQRTIASRTDLAMVRQTIHAYIDCEGTFASEGIDPKNPGDNCQSTSAIDSQQGPFLRLRRFNLNNSVQWLTEELRNDEYARLASWFIRVSCSESEQTLVIRAAQLVGGELDWYSPQSLLFGTGARSLPLCYVGEGAEACTPATFSTYVDGTNESFTLVGSDLPAGRELTLDANAGDVYSHCCGVPTCNFSPTTSVAWVDFRWTSGSQPSAVRGTKISLPYTMMVPSDTNYLWIRMADCPGCYYDNCGGWTFTGTVACP